MNGVPISMNQQNEESKQQIDSGNPQKINNKVQDLIAQLNQYEDKSNQAY